MSTHPLFPKNYFWIIPFYKRYKTMNWLCTISIALGVGYLYRRLIEEVEKPTEPPKRFVMRNGERVSQNVPEGFRDYFINKNIGNGES